MDCGGDFNEVLDESGKSGGRRKAKVAMDEFSKVTEDLALTDVKPDRGWFMWSNNKMGSRLVWERLDRFLVLTSWLSSVPFLASYIVCQANSDHNLVVLDTLGRMLKEERKDPKLYFQYENCWAKEEEAKRIIEEAWTGGQGDVLVCAERVRASLGRWQFRRFNDRKGRIEILQKEIYSVMNVHGNVQLPTDCVLPGRSWLVSTIQRCNGPNGRVSSNCVREIVT